MKCCLCGIYTYSGAPLCEKCMVKLEALKIGEPHCPVCGQELWRDLSICPECRDKEELFEDVRSIFRYRGEMRRILHLYKFEGIYSLSVFFAKIIYPYLLKYYPCHVIQIIPPRKGKIYKTGWDQMNKIAHCLPFPQVQYLKRARGLSQKSLNRYERYNQIIGQFKSQEIKSEERPILIVDDIRTTGSTLIEAARSLKEKGAGRLSALTIALD